MDHITDLSVRKHFIENALDLYVEISETKHGRIIFLAGETGSGRAATLKAMSSAFQREYPEAQVVGGSFVRNEFISWKSRIPGREILTLVGEAFPLVSLLSFAGALVSASLASWDLIQTLRATSPQNDFEFMEKLLRHGAAKKRLVCLLDNLNEAEIGWWTDLFLKLGPKIAVNLPVLFIVSVDGPPELDFDTDDDSPLFYIYKELIRYNQAEWWPLLPLSKEEIKRWLGPSEAEVVDQIHAITAGNPEWVKQLWESWEKNGVVYEERGRWKFTPGQEEPLTDPVWNLLGERLKSIFGDEDVHGQGEARRLLSYAALEGPIFTADAIAKLVEKTPDEVIDFLDDYLVWSGENLHGLLSEEDPLTINSPVTGPRHLCRYQFISRVYWMTLSRYGITDSEQRGAACKKLGPVLVDLYQGVEGFAAGNLARVFEGAGEQEQAKYYRRISDFRQSLDALYQQALVVLHEPKDGWDDRRYRWAIELFEVLCGKMKYVYPFEMCLPVYQELYNMTYTLYGSEHWEVGYSLNALAGLYRDYGRYEQAEPLHLRALEIKEKVLGPDHPDTAISLNNLASLYYHQGRYTEAEPLHLRALEIREKALGPDHPVTATSLGNLASLYDEQGRYTEAEPLHLRALEIIERVLGPDHPVTATSLHNLACLFTNQERYAEAEPLLQRALEICINILGEEHPHTQLCLKGLALLYDSQNNAAATQEEDEGARGETEGEKHCPDQD